MVVNPMKRESTRWTHYTISTELPEPQQAGEEETLPPAEARSVLIGRARLPAAIFLAILLILFVRLAYWQLLGTTPEPGPPAVQAAEPSRGRIVDTNGLLLATDNFIWEIYTNPNQFRQSDEQAALADELASIMGGSAEELRNLLLSSDAPLLTLRIGASEEQCQAVQALERPSVFWCAARRTRAYPMGPLAAHLLGFANYSLIGVYGVEASYDAWLRADMEWPLQRLPGAPQPIPEAWKLYLPSPGGRDLVLHLHAPLQHMVETRLAEALRFYEAEAGTIIILDPRTGGILALANLPTFDPNNYSEVSQEVWVNPAVSQIFEPGSVFKLITMAAALDTGLATPDTILEDEGYLQVADRFIRNAERKKYGQITLRDTLAKSVNVVTAKLCLELGPEIFYRYVHLFGFGKLTEIDLPLEGYGIVKEPGNPLWSYFDQATNSFGQGISVTAIQMINAVAAIANGGTLLQPQVVRGLIWNGQMYTVPPRVLGYPIKPETARTLTEMMVYTVEKSAYPNLVPGFRVAGKTGTAEIPTEQGYTAQETITSFVGFLPADDPQIAILVKLVKPKRARWAEQVAVPVFSQVAQDAVQALKMQPGGHLP
jgi:cell division protein FtsI/penicillin-binding protein 2